MARMMALMLKANLSQAVDNADRRGPPSEQEYRDDPWKLLDQLGPIKTETTIPDSVPDSEAQMRSTLIFLQEQSQYGRDRQFDRKMYFNKYISWWCPTFDTIQEMAQIISAVDPEKKRVLEVGSGSGLASRLLVMNGCTVYSTDHDPFPTAQSFHLVEKLPALDAMKKYRDAPTLLMAWPPQSGHEGYEMSADCIKNFTGTQIIYVGEPEGGCTGHPDFFKRIASGKWSLYKKLSVRRWPGLYDRVYVYRVAQV